MPSPYIQLLLVNMLLAALVSTVVFGAPILPAVAGAAGAGAMLYARYRAKTQRATSSSIQTTNLQGRRREVRPVEVGHTAPAPTGAVHGAVGPDPGRS